MEKWIANYNSFSAAVDRLIVTVLKLSWFENAKRAESLKEEPDLEKIVAWDRASRDCCESREALKNEIDRILTEAASSGYGVHSEPRTFAQPKKSVSDIIAEAAANQEQWKQELDEALSEIFK